MTDAQTFERTDLTSSRFRGVTFDRASFRSCEFSGVVMRGVEIVDTTIDGELQNVVINGVDVAPLIDAELDRRYPERPAFRPVDADGFRVAWDLDEGLWDATVGRARQLPAELLHASVDGEWSFTQTLRHLAFATESWIGRGVLGDPSPWHPLSLPWGEMTPTEGVPHDIDARPSLEETLVLRHEAMALMRRVLDGLTDAELERWTEPQPGPGWPRAGDTFAVRECLLVVLNEEWWHRRYAERDLAALEARL
jgi:hypothetical protein